MVAIMQRPDPEFTDRHRRHVWRLWRTPPPTRHTYRIQDGDCTLVRHESGTYINPESPHA